jgi:hypothetical protein
MDDMGHTSGRASVEGAPRNLARLDTLPPSHTPTGRERWAERSTRGLLCIPVLLPPQEDPQQPLRYPADRLIFLLTRYCAEKLGSARLGSAAMLPPFLTVPRLEMAVVVPLRGLRGRPPDDEISAYSKVCTPSFNGNHP